MVSPSDCNDNGQPEMARLPPKTATLPFLVVNRCCLGILSSNWPRSKHQLCLWNFDDICYAVRRYKMVLHFGDIRLCESFQST